MAEGAEGEGEGGGGGGGGGGGAGGGEHVEFETKLEFTPTWIVAAVCTLIIIISVSVERYLHHLGKFLKRNNQKPLFRALQKVKEELMILGFMSLLLTVSQGCIQNICIPGRWTHYMLPCKKRLHHGHRHHHIRKPPAEGEEMSHCSKKGYVPLLSVEAIDQLHIFLFILAITHLIFSAFTVVLGGAKINKWKNWEDSIQEEAARDVPQNPNAHQFQFIKDRDKSIYKGSVGMAWLHSFIKQFYASVSQSDYITLRLIFISTHCKGNPKFDFHSYMVRAFENDFMKVVGISWYLWVYVIVFLLLNIDGLETYNWIAFIPLILLVVGTKLENVITELAHDVAEKYFNKGGALVVDPSDEYFWFNQPRILLYSIHFILFQNAFDIAFLFWLFIPYGFGSCVINHFGYAILRIVIGYSTLPLYAIVTQMGTNFSKTIFDKQVRENLVFWAEMAKKRRFARTNGEGTSSSN